MSKSAVDQRKNALKAELEQTKTKISKVEDDLRRIENAYGRIRDRFKSQGEDEIKALTSKIQELERELDRERTKQLESEAALQKRIKEKEQGIRNLEEDLRPMQAELKARASDYKSSVTDANQVFSNAIQVIGDLQEKLRDGVDAVSARQGFS